MLIIYKWQKDIDIVGGLYKEQEIGNIFQFRVTLKFVIFWILGVGKNNNIWYSDIALIS